MRGYSFILKLYDFSILNVHLEYLLHHGYEEKLNDIMMCQNSEGRGDASKD